MDLSTSVAIVVFSLLLRIMSFSHCLISVPDIFVFLLFLTVEGGSRFLQKIGNWLLDATVSHPKNQKTSESNGFRTRSSKLLFCIFGNALDVMCSGR
jgi:hypothetical protein